MKFRMAILTIPLLITLSGCGTTESVKIDIPPATVQTFTFQDKRPAEQRLSRKTASSSGNSFFYADNNLSPPPAELLRRVLINRASDLLKGHTVTLTEFDVHVTLPPVAIDENALRTSSASVPNASPAGVALAAPVILGIDSIKSYKIVTVEIRGRIDNTELYAYHSDEFQGHVSEDDIRGVIMAALDYAITQVHRIVHG